MSRKKNEYWDIILSFSLYLFCLCLLSLPVLFLCSSCFSLPDFLCPAYAHSCLELTLVSLFWPLRSLREWLTPEVRSIKLASELSAPGQDRMHFQKGPLGVRAVHIRPSYAIYKRSLRAHSFKLTFPFGKNTFFTHSTHSPIKVIFFLRCTRVQKLFCHESVIALKMPLDILEESISNQIME